MNLISREVKDFLLVVDNNLTCAVCNEQYDNYEREPLVMPCGHTLCKVCMSKIPRESSNKCAFCRRAFDPLLISRNWAISDLIEARGKPRVLELLADLKEEDQMSLEKPGKHSSWSVILQGFEKEHMAEQQVDLFNKAMDVITLQAPIIHRDLPNLLSDLLKNVSRKDLKKRYLYVLPASAIDFSYFIIQYAIYILLNADEVKECQSLLDVGKLFGAWYMTNQENLDTLQDYVIPPKIYLECLRIRSDVISKYYSGIFLMA